jgi:hypothetical protein
LHPPSPPSSRPRPARRHHAQSPTRPNQDHPGIFCKHPSPLRTYTHARVRRCVWLSRGNDPTPAAPLSCAGQTHRWRRVRLDAVGLGAGWTAAVVECGSERRRALCNVVAWPQLSTQIILCSHRRRLVPRRRTRAMHWNSSRDGGTPATQQRPSDGGLWHREGPWCSGAWAG